MAGRRMLHHLERAEVPDGQLSRAYLWGPEGRPNTEPWRCSCKATGQGQEAAQAHLSAKAKAAFARMDHSEAFATASVSGANHASRDSFSLLMMTLRWYGHPALRRHMRPYYDHFGCIAAALDWQGVAADLQAGKIEGEDSDLLVLRVAISLAGVAVPLRLADLWRLPESDTRHVRDALLNQLKLEGEAVDGPLP